MVVSHGPESFAVGKHLDVLRDDSGHLTLAQVSAPENKGRWKKSRREVPNFGFSSATYWFRFRVRSSASRAHTWLLEVGYPMLDRVDVYQSLPGGGWDHEVGGDHLPFSARSIPHRNFVFRVPLDPGETRTVLLRVATQSSVQVPLTLWSRDGFLHKDHKEQAALWTYYGLVLVMALYNLFIFLSVRDRSYIYYVGEASSFAAASR